MTESAEGHPFATLTPDFVLDAVEAQGCVTDGRMLALNSYENRVYQVGIEDADPVVVKFYRPQRWSDAQIHEEHDLLAELEAQEIPVVTPHPNAQGETLSHYQGIRLAIFPRRGGRAPELDNLDNLYILGQRLGRMHNVGAARAFAHRPKLTVQTYGYDSADFLLDGFIPASLRESYRTLSQDLLQRVESQFQALGELDYVRAHSDCHIGNILWRDDTPHFVDFDDARMAPAIQDLWMLLSGDRTNQLQQLAEVIEGYEMFRPFNPQELKLIEPLRTLRMMHHSAWLARRWDDPAFPMHFSWFNTERYWGEHILQLREQFALLHEPPLTLTP